METPEDACCHGAKKRTEQQPVAEKGHAEKTHANRANQKQGAGIIGENQDMLGFVEGDELFFIKHGGDLRPHGITGKDT